MIQATRINKVDSSDPPSTQPASRSRLDTHSAGEVACGVDDSTIHQVLPLGVGSHRVIAVTADGSAAVVGRTRQVFQESESASVKLDVEALLTCPGERPGFVSASSHRLSANTAFLITNDAQICQWNGTRGNFVSPCGSLMGLSTASIRSASKMICRPPFSLTTLITF